jgi:hypothetical protein
MLARQCCRYLTTDKTMTPDLEWTPIDTETPGIVRSIWVIEIGAKRMQGWAPVGPSFRLTTVTLFDVALSYRASAR